MYTLYIHPIVNERDTDFISIPLVNQSISPGQGRSRDFWFRGGLILSEVESKKFEAKNNFRLQRALSTSQIQYSNEIDNFFCRFK